MKKTNKLSLRKNVIARLGKNSMQHAIGAGPTTTVATHAITETVGQVDLSKLLDCVSGPCHTLFTNQCPHTLNHCVTGDC